MTLTVGGEPPAASAKVKIFGERNTGTHALIRIVETNSASKCLPGVAKEVEPQSARKIGSRFITNRRREAIIDDVFARHGPLESWKHRATNFPDPGVFKDMLVLFTVRHPASWLLSLWKNPYHALDRVPRTIGEFVDFHWRTSDRDGLGKQTLLPLQLYREKLRSYVTFAQALSSQQIPHRFVRFEELVTRQEEVYRDLAPLLSKPADQFTELRRSTKDPSKDLAYYTRYYGEERWREELRGLEERINAQVDWDAVERFGYRPL